jgi:hypothetical protein
MRRLLSACCVLILVFALPVKAADPWLEVAGGDGPGKGKKVVLISGDEEYRSEEALPQLAKILARHHGFDCTVVFAIDPATGQINPNTNDNIPGLEKLDSADLMVIATRFRNLPDEQMKHVDAFLKAGKPVVAMRTATHAFNIPEGRAYRRWSWDNGGEGFAQGFGRQVLGEIWGPTDVYGVRLPLPGDSKPLVLGAVLAGMKPDSPPVTGEKNEPMMPVAWTKSYSVDGGPKGRAFTTTMGAATDMTAEGTRRMLVNACYWAAGLEAKIPEKSKVDIVGSFEPTPFGFNGAKKGLTPADYR